MTLAQRVVHRVRAGAGGLTEFLSSGVAYDVAFGGLPFMLATDKDTPLRRGTADYNKQQVDQSPQPGEQSLAFWWLRSQISFHGGAGRTFADPDVASRRSVAERDADAGIRFESSVGVDVWTEGQVTLLPGAATAVAGSAEILLGANDDTNTTALQANGAVLKRLLLSGGVLSSSTVTWGGTGNILALAQDGANYYAANATGIYSGTLAGGAGSLLWGAYTSTTHVALGWVKQRLMAGVANKLYELVGVTGALPTAKYTHPVAGWQWTCFAEGPDAVYAAGYSGGESAIVRLTLDSQGQVPTLTSAAVVAQMPHGETVTAIYAYLGTFLMIGTNKGIRVAVIDPQSGTITYGPLTVTLNDGDPAVKGFIGQDRFVYCGWPNGISGNSGLVRIDLSREMEAGRYAYAGDLQGKVTGQVTGVALLGSKRLFAVAGTGSFVESGVEASGTLMTGRIRIGTLEPKLFREARVRVTLPIVGTVAAEVIDEQGVAVPLVTYSGSVSLDPVAIPLGKQEFIQMRFTLTASGSNSPTFRGYQVKALPAGKRQRVHEIPVFIFDTERDRNGVGFGTRSSGIQRLIALETLEEAGGVVRLQYLTADPDGRVSSNVVIDKIDFVQMSPPKNFSGWGGVALVTVRSVT